MSKLLLMSQIWRAFSPDGMFLCLFRRFSIGFRADVALSFWSLSCCQTIDLQLRLNFLTLSRTFLHRIPWKFSLYPAQIQDTLCPVLAKKTREPPPCFTVGIFCAYALLFSSVIMSSGAIKHSLLHLSIIRWWISESSWLCDSCV